MRIPVNRHTIRLRALLCTVRMAPTVLHTCYLRFYNAIMAAKLSNPNIKW